MSQQLKCVDKVGKAYESRMDDLRKLCNDTDDIEGFYAYGLGIDKVEAGTFEGQREDYIRYQLSWGGPSEEFRIYRYGNIEFWYLDWFDGASVDVTGEDAKIIHDIVGEWSDYEN